MVDDLVMKAVQSSEEHNAATPAGAEMLATADLYMPLLPALPVPGPIEMQLDPALNRNMLVMEQQLSQMQHALPMASRTISPSVLNQAPQLECCPLAHLAGTGEAPAGDSYSWPRREPPLRSQPSTRPASGLTSDGGFSAAANTTMGPRLATPSADPSRCHASRASTPWTHRRPVLAHGTDVLLTLPLVSPPSTQLSTPGASSSDGLGIRLQGQQRVAGRPYHLHDGLTPGQRALGAVGQDDRFAAPRCASERSCAVPVAPRPKTTLSSGDDDWRLIQMSRASRALLRAVEAADASPAEESAHRTACAEAVRKEAFAKAGAGLYVALTETDLKELSRRYPDSDSGNGRAGGDGGDAECDAAQPADQSSASCLRPRSGPADGSLAASPAEALRADTMVAKGGSPGSRRSSGLRVISTRLARGSSAGTHLSASMSSSVASRPQPEAARVMGAKLYSVSPREMRPRRPPRLGRPIGPSIAGSCRHAGSRQQCGLRAEPPRCVSPCGSIVPGDEVLTVGMRWDGVTWDGIGWGGAGAERLQVGLAKSSIPPRRACMSGVLLLSSRKSRGTITTVRKGIGRALDEREAGAVRPQQAAWGKPSGDGTLSALAHGSSVSPW